MEISLKEDYKNYIEKQNLEVRNMVLAGLEQVKYGKTKDFDEVCDRLEKKYRDASVQN
jgi:hypothetical protein